MVGQNSLCTAEQLTSGLLHPSGTTPDNRLLPVKICVPVGRSRLFLGCLQSYGLHPPAAAMQHRGLCVAQLFVAPLQPNELGGLLQVLKETHVSRLVVGQRMLPVCCCGRYEDSYKWTTDGSCQLQHLRVVDTTACSLQHQVEQVMDFLVALEAGARDSVHTTAAAAAAAVT